MFWIWIFYKNLQPYLKIIAETLIFGGVLFLIRPFFLWYFGIRKYIFLMKENNRLQKKILEEIQINRRSLHYNDIFKGATMKTLEKSPSKLVERDLIEIDLKE